jgi:hypothetical protein
MFRLPLIASSRRETIRIRPKLTGDSIAAVRKSQLSRSGIYVALEGGPTMSVAFVREESAEAAQEASLPARAISAHPNLVTQSGLRGLERALAKSQQALKAGQMVEDANERRRALELAGAGRTLLRGTRRERGSAA